MANCNANHQLCLGSRPLSHATEGLSYTSFTYTPSASATSVSMAPVTEMLATTYEAGRTFPSSHLLAASAPLANYMVNVTNTGKMDADDVVLGFLVPPGAGKDGVRHRRFFFESLVNSTYDGGGCCAPTSTMRSSLSTLCSYQHISRAVACFSWLLIYPTLTLTLNPTPNPNHNPNPNP
jgi:hypothetical protein